MTVSLKEAALHYAHAGYRVVPLHTPLEGGRCSCGRPGCDRQGKHPRNPRGLSEGTTDPDQIAAWWDQWPDANIAVLTGGDKRLFVLDVDSPTLAVDLPETLTIQSGRSGGRHYWLEGPEGVFLTNRRGSLPIGVDVRGEGGYVVAPPSLHASGRRYQVVQPGERAPVPPWLLETVRTGQNGNGNHPAAAPVAPLPPAPLTGSVGGYVQRAIELECWSVLQAREGERNHKLNVAAFNLGQLVGGGALREADVVDALLRAAHGAGLGKHESELTIQSGLRAGREKPRTAPEPRTSSFVRPDVQPAEGEEVEDSWEPVDLTLREMDPPPPPTIGGMLYPGWRHVLSGEPEGGKSWLALALTLGELREGRVAVYIDHEMGAAMVLERLRVLGATNGEISQLLYVDDPQQPLRSSRALAGILSREPSLVVIDSTIGSLVLHGFDPDKGVDVERWNGEVLRPLRSSGAALLSLDHVTKSKESRGKYTIGSERKIGLCEVHLSCEVVAPFGRGRDGRARVSVQKDRGGHLPRPTLGSFSLRSGRPDPWLWEAYRPREGGEPEEPHFFRPTGIMMTVSMLLERGPASRREIRSAVAGAKAQTVNAAIDSLTRERWAVEEHGKIRSLAPFVDGQPPPEQPDA